MLVISIIILVLSLVATVLAIALVVGLVYTGGVPFVSTPKKDFTAILRVADLQPGQTIYDLGCGKAHLLIKATKEFQAKGIGYELSLTPYLWAKWRIWLRRADVKVYLKNFFPADLSNADVVFCYLFPEVMKKLEPKFQAELKLGSKVVAYGFPLAEKNPQQIIATNNDNAELGKIFVYQY